jgi:HEAT repeat protein
LDWPDTGDLLGCDDPAEVDAGFDRGEPLIGVAVIGLALNVLAPEVVAPRLHRAMADVDAEVRYSGALSVGHMARLNGRVDRESLDLLLGLLNDPDPGVRGPAGDALMDVWISCRKSRLPWWVRRRCRLRDLRGKADIAWWWHVVRRQEAWRARHRPPSS